MYYIYKHTNNINGKIYIGQTNNPDKRWGSNGEHYKPREEGTSHFYCAIKKYGWENFSHEILATCESRDQANELEQYYIKTLDSTNPDIGYNLSSGGNIRDWYAQASDERKKEYQDKRREISYRLWSDSEYREKQRIGMEKVMQSEEYKNKMSEIIKERYTDEEYKKKWKKAVRQKSGQPIQCIETKEIFRCITEATEAMGGKSQSNSINFCLNGKYKTAYGYTWRRITLEEFLELKEQGYYHGEL